MGRRRRHLARFGDVAIGNRGFNIIIAGGFAASRAAIGAGEVAVALGSVQMCQRPESWQQRDKTGHPLLVGEVGKGNRDELLPFVSSYDILYMKQQLSSFSWDYVCRVDLDSSARALYHLMVNDQR